MAKNKILHRYLKEGETISVDAKATLQIDLHKIKKLFKFKYTTFDKDSRNLYNSADLPSSLHNDFNNIKMHIDIDFENPIQLTQSIVTKTNIKTECGCEDDDTTLMDDYISYLKIHGHCDNVDKTKKRINKRVTHKFYSTLMNDKDGSLNILSKMYHNSPSDFEHLPLNIVKPRNFPFKKNDKLLFVLTFDSESIKPRDYLITLKIV
jgi:hypothetical protein